jgi:exocyst complex component 2
MTQLVNRLSTVLLDRLPDFWRIAKGHIEGKYSKVCMRSRRLRILIKHAYFATPQHKAHGRRQAGQARVMTIEIVKLYVSCISQFFTLSDVAIASSPNNQTANEIPDFLPPTSNSITTCHFVSRILTEIVETSGELEGMGGHVEGEKISSQVEVKNVLKGLAESCRWRFEEAICSAWSKGTS